MLGTISRGMEGETLRTCTVTASARAAPSLSPVPRGEGRGEGRATWWTENRPSALTAPHVIPRYSEGSRSRRALLLLDPSQYLVMTSEHSSPKPAVSDVERRSPLSPGTV